jgi:surface protein
MFRDSTALTTLDLTNFNTSNVTNMSSMFNNCEALTTLDVSDFDTSNVTNMSYMFQNCESLTNLDLSNFNTSNVSQMVAIFQNCRTMTSLDVSSWNVGSHITSYERMFSGCTSLNKLYIKQGTKDWWCDRLREAGLSCEIIDYTNTYPGGGIVDAE